MADKSLDFYSYLPILLLYLFSGIFKYTLLTSIIRHILFLVVFLSIFWFQYRKNATYIRKNRLYSYLCLYAAAVLILMQNSLLILIHGYTVVNFSISRNQTDLASLLIFPELYHSVYVLDLLGFAFYFLYFLFLHPSEKKIKFKQIGLLASLVFIIFTLAWRLFSGFYVTNSFREWVVLLRADSITLGLLAQLAFGLLWYALYELHKVDARQESHYLDNQTTTRSGIDRVALQMMIVSIISTIGLLTGLTYGLNLPFSNRQLILFSVKTIFLPIIIIFGHLKIFQRFNLLF